MLVLEKNFAKIFIPAFIKGDKALLSTIPGVQIFDHEDDDDVHSSHNGKKNVQISNGTATIKILGMLGDDLPWWINHTSYISIVEGVRIAEADESVEEIVYLVDSPGGFVSGFMPAALAMRNGTKPSKALIANMAASGGYMLASQADKIEARDFLTSVGSIGVANEFMDFTRFFVEMGIDIYTFTNEESKDKRPDLSTKEGRQVIQDGIDEVYHEIEVLIAEGRGVTVEFLRENFGAGRVMLAKAGLSAKMVDEIKQKDILSENGISESEEIEKDDEMADKIINISDLKAAHPGLCSEMISTVTAEAKAEGVKEGQAIEKKRVSGWVAFNDVEPEAVAAGIKGNEEIDDSTRAIYAVKKVNQDNLQSQVDENGDDNGKELQTGEVNDDEVDAKKLAEKTAEAEFDAEYAKIK